MTRLIAPILLIVAAIGLFTLVTNPTYQGTKVLSAKAGAYDDALNKAQQLRQRRDELLAKFNTFTAADKQKLQSILPDNVDNIRLIIDINNIAARHSLSLRNVELGSVSDASSARSALSVGPSGEKIGSVDVGFSVTATYDDFLSFLADVERSLRLVDVEKLSLRPAEGGRYDLSFNIRTYWLH